MEENVLQRVIERKGDRFEENKREPDHRVHLPKLEVFRKDESFKVEPFNKILHAPVRESRMLKVEPIRNTDKQHIFKHDIHPKNKPKQLNQLP